MDVTEFLRARLDEDERVARGARQEFFTVGVLGMFSAVGDSRHVVRHDPARVLREVEAKRRMLDEHSDVIDGSCATFRLLALPYADHPDYRQEWRP